MDGNGKVAVVTGASRGIGRSLAMGLARAGYRLALVARDAGKLEEVAGACREAGAQADVFALDMLKVESFAECRTAIMKACGRIDVLINNAGSGGGGNILEVDPERWDTCLQTNLIGLMHWTRTLAPDIIKSADGAIINIGSIASRTTYGGGAAYAASKHAVLGFTGCLFEDVREHGVKVCALLPGFVDTEMVTNDSLNRSRMIAPEDVAEAALYVLGSSPRVCPTEIVLRPQKTPYK